MVTPTLTQEITTLHADICSALAEPRRILILYALNERPRNVSELAEELSISQPAASRHLNLLRERGITLEVNPWSNYLTNSVPTIESHPLKKLFDLGVRVTVNSDDPEVLETNLNNEYRIAHEVLGMSIEDLAVCNRYAYEASFIPEPSRTRTWNKYFS